MNAAKRIVVLGLYRSGTSMIAGVLHRLGVCMGREFHGNFYEPKLLSKELRLWWDEPRGIEKVSAAHRVAYLRNWIEGLERDHACPVGAKHPLLSLCGPEILEAWGPQTQFIWAFRPLAESIAGLKLQRWPNFINCEESLQRKLWVALSGFEHKGKNIVKLEKSWAISNREAAVDRLASLAGVTPTAQQQQAAISSILPF